MKDYIYYGIKNPEDRVTHISYSEHEAWHKFFDYNGHRLPIAEAIQAYEAIGYKCIQCRLIRVDQMENNKMNGIMPLMALEEIQSNGYDIVMTWKGKRWIVEADKEDHFFIMKERIYQKQFSIYVML